MKKLLLSILSVSWYFVAIAQIDLAPNNGFAVCPNVQITYSASMTNGSICSFFWEITGGTFQGGSTTATGNPVTVTWSSSATSGSLKLTTSSCNPSSNNNQTVNKPFAIKSLAGANLGNVSGSSSVNVNVTTSIRYTVSLIEYPRGSSDPNPFYVTDYDWQVPTGWTITNKGYSVGNVQAYVDVKPDNCTGGIIRARAKSNCGNYYSNWSPNFPVTRTIPTPGAITGPDQLNCSDITPRTYSISAVTGAESYTWTLPYQWGGTSTSTSINVTPNGLNGGTITVKANACGIQSSASSKPITLNLTDPNNPPGIAGSSPVCYVSQPLNGTDFTLSNLPQNSTVSWTTSSTLAIVSGQSTTTLRVKASSFSTSDRGWVEALITTPCGSPPPIRYNVWAGKPYDFLVNGPILVQAGSFNFYEMKKWGWPTNNSYASFTEQGIAPSGFTWSFGWPPTSAGWNCGGCVGEYNTIQAGSQSTYVTAHVQNTCGIATRNYEVFVQQQDCPPGGCEDPFFVYPNPSSEELTVSTNLTDEDAMSELTLVNSQGSVVYTTKTKAKEQIKIPVREFENGLYYLKVNQNGVIKQRQVIINH